MKAALLILKFSRELTEQEERELNENIHTVLQGLPVIRADFHPAEMSQQKITAPSETKNVPGGTH